MSVLWSDLRLAVRMPMKAPGLSLAAIVALALGIGPNTAIFSIVYATLLAPLPYPQPDQLVMVWSQNPLGVRNAVSRATTWSGRNTPPPFSISRMRYSKNPDPAPFTFAGSRA